MKRGGATERQSCSRHLDNDVMPKGIYITGTFEEDEEEMSEEDIHPGEGEVCDTDEVDGAPRRRMLSSAKHAKPHFRSVSRASLFETDLDVDVANQEIDRDISGRTKYLKRCEELGAKPIGKLIRTLEKNRLRLRYYYLDNTSTQALCSPLKINTYVTELDLADNGLSFKSLKSVIKMLYDNCFITDLNLSNNQIGSEGLILIKRLLESSTPLTRLRMRSCNYKDCDGEILSEIIESNKRIEILDISHNRLEDRAGMKIAKALCSNDTLLSIDLGWNCFRKATANALVETIHENIRLKELKIAWNGLGNEGIHLISHPLCHNEVLKILDISGTRITMHGVEALCFLVANSSYLSILKINSNMLNEAAAEAIMKAAIGNETKCLMGLEIDTAFPNPTLLQLAEELRDTRPGFEIKLRGNTDTKFKLKDIVPL